MSDVTSAYLKGRMDELQSLLDLLEKEREEKDIPIYVIVGAIKLRMALCESVENITEVEVKE